MASTRQDFMRDRMTRGVDYSTPPHLIEDNFWKDARNFRTYLSKVSQLPYFKRKGLIGSGDPVYGIVNLPVSDQGEALILAFTSQEVYQLRPESPASSVALKYEDGTSPSFTEGTGIDRFSLAMYARQVWFTNRHTPLHYTDGAKIGTYATPLPKARFIETFFDHIVVANAEFQGLSEPYTVRWSHLYDPSQWVPTPENEADYFEVTEWVRGEEAVGGITGLKKQGDTLICYTETSIIACRYVGLPKVMQFAPVALDTGCGFYHTLVAYKGMHYYLDRANRNFYRFDGRAATPIGDRVVRRMLESDGLDFGSVANSSRAFVLPEMNEVWWHLPIGGGMVFIYNWNADAWTFAATFFDLGGGSLQCTGSGSVRAQSCDEQAGTADSLTGTADQLSVSGEPAQPRLYGENQGYLLREAVNADSTVEGGALGSFQTPYLETGDRTFGSINQTKEMDGITLDVEYPDGKCTGILVELSARERLGDTVTYSKVGVWHKGLKDNFLSFPKRVSGKIFRWRFTPQQVLPTPPRGVLWNAFTEHVYGRRAER